MTRPTFPEAKRRFVQRFTMEHIPKWALRPCNVDGLTLYHAPQFKTDREWYDNSKFKGESQLADATHCYTTGLTWPLGQWLSYPYRFS